jgi:hypothetical protein
MADPVLDEQLIIDLIETKPAADTMNRLRAGALMLVVDAYDRKITRERFLMVAHTAMALHSYASQYTGVDNMQDLFRAGKLDDAVLTDALGEATKLLESYIDRALKEARLLKQCPLSVDKVH